MYERSANNQWIDQYTSYLVVQYAHNYVCLPSSQLPAAACVDTMSHVGSRPSIGGSYKTYLRHYVFYFVHMYLIYFCFSKADKLLSVIVLLVHFKADKP